MSSASLVKALVGGVANFVLFPFPQPPSVIWRWGLVRAVQRRFRKWGPNAVVDGPKEVSAPGLIQEPDQDLSQTTDDILDSSSVVVGRKVRHKRGYCKLVAEELKIKFPYVGLKRTTADYMTVHHCAVQVMTAHKMVPSHIARMAPLVVALVFIPSEAEVEAQLLSQTGAVEDRVLDYQATTIDHWLDILTGGGRRVRFVRT